LTSVLNMVKYNRKDKELQVINKKIIQLISDAPIVSNIRPRIIEFMNDKVQNYPDSWSLYQKTYHELYLEQSSESKRCPSCGALLKFKGLKIGYARHCSHSCRNNNPETKLKYKQTCIDRYGVEFASQSDEFKKRVRDTCVKNYGVDNPFKLPEIQDRQKTTVLKKYGVSNVSKSEKVLEKIRNSHVNSGNWVSDEERSDLEKYRLQVKKISARSYHDHYYKINPNNLKRSRYQYHLDHIFSVEEGFKNNIPPEVIGHWTNLRMLWHLDNSKKNTKCHKTINELYEDYAQKND